MIVWSIASSAPDVPRCARLGLEALNSQDLNAAQEWFADGMGSTDPDEVLACVVGLAGLAAARGDVSSAEKLLERARRSGRTDATVNLARLKWECGAEEEALTLYQEAARSRVNAIRLRASEELAACLRYRGCDFEAQATLETVGFQGSGVAIRHLVHQALDDLDIEKLHVWLEVGRNSGDEYLCAMYEVAVPDLVGEARTEWVRPERLARLARHSDWRIRRAVLQNPSTDDDIAAGLRQDDDVRVWMDNIPSDDRAAKPLRTCTSGVRVLSLRPDLMVAEMEVAVKEHPNNFLIRGQLQGARKMARESKGFW